MCVCTHASACDYVSVLMISHVNLSKGLSLRLRPQETLAFPAVCVFVVCVDDVRGNIRPSEIQCGQYCPIFNEFWEYIIPKVLDVIWRSQHY